MPTAPETWDRQPGESEVAYKAFRAFRDAGADRSMIDVYRQETGRKQAADPSGQWAGWAKAHDWKGRARDWDNHRDAAATRAVARVAEQSGEKWAQRLTAQADADFAFAQKYAAEMARRLNDADALRAMPAKELKDCIAVTTAASQLAWAAIAAALPDLYADLDTSAATTEQLTAAIERLDRTIGAAAAPVQPRIARAG
jgi:hypothetical protein